jgi:surfeit locus 1 family protein
MVALHLAAVTAVVLAFLLGQWQFGAWQEHRTDRTAELRDAAPQPLADVLGPDDPFPADGVGRPVTVAGRWLPGSTVYVANRGHAARTGFWMVTALTTCPADSCSRPAAIPVVLGWTDAVDDAPTPPSGAATVTGWLQPGDTSGEPDPDPEDDVLPALRIPALLQRVDQDLYGGYLIAELPVALRTGLVAVTPDSLPKPSAFTALRNLFYGLQWWFFGGFAAFLWWRWCRDEVVAARIRSEA